MELIGMLDSPYVRRVAVTAQFLDIAYDHNPLSIFKGYDEFRQVNPLVKAPTIVSDDGEMLVDSTLIIGYLETLSTNGKCLMLEDAADRFRALQIIGVALVAMEESCRSDLREDAAAKRDTARAVDQTPGSAITKCPGSVGGKCR